jgi:hypothetical protein
VLLFQDQLGEGVALQIILLFRLISIIGDISVFLAVYLIKKQSFERIGIKVEQNTSSEESISRKPLGQGAGS